MVWDLALRAGGQIRTGGMGTVTGFDMTAVLALGAALGVPAVAIAEFFPTIEAVAVRQLNERGSDGA